jgi:hypothetical protein
MGELNPDAIELALHRQAGPPTAGRVACDEILADRTALPLARGRIIRLEAFRRHVQKKVNGNCLPLPLP